MWYIYTVEYYSVIKRKNAICGNMDATREVIILGKVSQKEKDK